MKITAFKTDFHKVDKIVFGCRIYPFANSKACIEYHRLPLLRNVFEDNISETDMIGINDKDGNQVFWGSFDELIEKLK